MGTTLTGTTPQDTYDSLIKVTNNGPLSSTARYLSDGLGNDSVLALSTARVGVGTATPSQKLSVSGGNLLVNNGTSPDSNSGIRIVAPISTTQYNWMIGAQENINNGFEITPSTAVGGATFSTPALSILAPSGNVGIGTSAPESKLHIAGTASGSDVTLYIDNVAASTLNNSTRLKFSSDLGSSVSGGGAELNCTIVDAGNGAVDLLVKSWSGGAYTEKARFLAGGGLTFNGDTAAANALDDYEEGTWTPVLSFAGGTTGITYSEQTGKYTKIGRQVTVEATIVLTSKGSSTGRVEITVPFTSTSDQYTGAIELRNATFTQKYAIVEVGRAAGTFARVILIDSASNSAELTNTGVANDSAFLFSFTYFV